MFFDFSAAVGSYRRLVPDDITDFWHSFVHHSLNSYHEK